MRLVNKFKQFWLVYMLLINMVVTIQQVLRPLLITSFIMGLSTYPKKQSNLKNRWIAHLSILYCLTIWFFYAYLLYYALSSFKCEMLCGNIMLIIFSATNILTAIISAIMNFYHQKKFEISLKKLSTVEDSLEELGVPKTYHKIHICSRLVVIGWIVFSLIRIVSDATWITKSSYFGKLFLSYVFNHCLRINAFLDLLFIFLMWYIDTRFDKVNELMLSFLVKGDYWQRYTKKKSVIALHRYTLCTDYKQTLWTSIHLHLELCRIVRELNFIFGTQITFEMAKNLIYFTWTCYGFFIMLMQKFPVEISSIVWFNGIFSFFELLIKVYAVNYICQSVMDKANKIDKIIHQLTNTVRYADSCQEIYQFTLQVMHRPLKLTGMNLFYLGNECLRKFYPTIVTYLVIMVQMKIRLK